MIQKGGIKGFGHNSFPDILLATIRLICRSYGWLTKIVMGTRGVTKEKQSSWHKYVSCLTRQNLFQANKFALGRKPSHSLILSSPRQARFSKETLSPGSVCNNLRGHFPMQAQIRRDSNLPFTTFWITIIKHATIFLRKNHWREEEEQHVRVSTYEGPGLRKHAETDMVGFQANIQSLYHFPLQDNNSTQKHPRLLRTIQDRDASQTEKFGLYCPVCVWTNCTRQHAHQNIWGTSHNIPHGSVLVKQSPSSRPLQ